MKLIMLLLAVSMSWPITPAQEIGLCLCRPRPSNTEENAVRLERDESAAVFAGRVIAITQGAGDTVKVRFRVAESWKGVSGTEVVIATHRSADEGCGYKFLKGRSYLVYAVNSGAQGLETNTCTRTRKMSEAKVDLGVLGKGQSPKKARE